MDILTTIIRLFDHHIIRGIFISVLLIIIVRKFYKKIDTQNSIRIVKWLLITYSVAIVLSFLLFFIFSIDSDKHSIFWERARGPYYAAYWTMFVASLLPLLLFLKKLSSNIYFVLVLSILPNIGWLFESFVIHISSFHRDYLDQANNYKALLPLKRELLIIFEGTILGILILVVGNLFRLAKR